MKKIVVVLFLLATTQLVKANNYADTGKLYNPTANATADIKEAVSKAKSAGKHVLIMAGGNWCSWCLRFNKFITEDKQLDSALNAGFIIYHLNYSPENKNAAVFAKYNYPQRFGYPVFLVLDAKGNRMHTQNSAYLEEGKGYNKKKVLEFFHDWSPSALDAKNYVEKAK